MNGEPVDPIWYPLAIQALWEKLAAHEGVSIKQHQLADREGLSEEQEAKRRQVDERLAQLHDEARFRIWQLVWAGDVRAWLDGETWKRPTGQVLRKLLTEPRDEPVPLYLDQIEVNAVAEAYWSEELTSTLPASQANPVNQPRRSRGRPPASGTYGASDAPLLDEMRSLKLSGKARSINQAAEMVAHKAQGGGSDASKAARLRKAYVRMWGVGE